MDNIVINNTVLTEIQAKIVGYALERFALEIQTIGTEEDEFGADTGQVYFETAQSVQSLFNKE